MAWLGEELADQSGRTRAPRTTTKDVIEEALFARRRDLFSELELVFFDTSALYFYGSGGPTLGQRGKSKDGHPELKQVVIGVVIDRQGRPVRYRELWKVDIDQACRLSRLCGRGLRWRGGRRQAPPRCRSGADRLQLSNNSFIGMHQLDRSAGAGYQAAT